MPRLIRDTHCPHCAVPLPQEQPRVCPSCGGSLQVRYMRYGCLSSAPKLLVFALCAWWLVTRM